MATNMSQGMSKAATASAAHDHRRPGDAPARSAAGKRASRMTNTSMSAVVAAADSCDAMPAAPSPKRSLTASLASAPPVSGKPARLRPSSAATISGQHSSAAVEHGDRAYGQEQSRLHQHMVRRIERDVRRRALVGARERHAERRGDHAHLADARIGEHCLRIALGHADRDAIESRDESEPDERLAPTGKSRA